MTPYLKTKDFSVSGEDFELHYDQSRDILVTHPKPKQLDKYYESDDYISHTDASRGLVEKIYQWVKGINLKRKFSLIDRYSKGIKTLLDVGAGTGDFLVTAKNKGWTVRGVEPNLKARVRANDKQVSVVEDIEVLSGTTYEIITLWHVLEHLPNLEASIQNMASLLNDQGTLVIAVPNYRSWDAKHYGEHWAAYDVPRHLWHFSAEGIQSVFKEYDFSMIKKKPMWFDAFYVAILSEKYKRARFPMIKGLCYGLWSNLSALLTKECSSQIYIFQKN